MQGLRLKIEIVLFIFALLSLKHFRISLCLRVCIKVLLEFQKIVKSSGQIFSSKLFLALVLYRKMLETGTKAVIVILLCRQ